MATVRQDRIQVKLEIDASQNFTELDNLTRRQQVITDQLKGMKKGTEEYVKANAELRQVTARIGELQNEIGITALPYRQLVKLQGELKRELAGLVPGTEAFVEKSARLIEVENRLGQVKEAMHGIQEEGEKTGGVFVKIGSIVTGALAFAGVQLGLDMLREFATSSVEEFEQAENAAAQLEATLLSTGEAAGITKDKALEISTALEGKTIFDGDAITQAQSLLLTFTQIKDGVYQEAVPAIADMATKLAGDGPVDLKGATIQVGKALNDPIKGITALSKAGVSFSEDQKVLIKSLVETGQVADAQRIILDELKKEFGGSAEAAAKAGTGPIKQFQIQIGNAKEAVGEFIVRGLELIAPALKVLLSGFVTFLGILRAVPSFVIENRGALAGLAVALLTLNSAQIASTASTLIDTGVQKAKIIWTNALRTANDLLKASMLATPWGATIAIVSLLVGVFVTLYERSDKVRAGFAGLAAVAVQVFRNIKDAVVTHLSGVADVLVGIFTLDVERIKKGLVGAFEGLKKGYTGLGEGVATAYHQGYEQRMQQEEANREKAEADRAAKRKAQAEKDAKDRAQADVLAELKAQEAAIELKLAKVREDSLQELRLKQELIKTKALIELEDEKKTAADKLVIQAKAQREIAKLEVDFNEKRRKEAEELAKERIAADRRVVDAQLELIPNTTERRLAQLKVAAEREITDFKGSEEQRAAYAQARRQKLENDLAALRKDAHDKELKAAEEQTNKLIDLENRKEKALADAALIRAERSGSPEAVLAAKINLLQTETEAELENKELTEEEKTRIQEEYEQKRDELHAKYIDDQFKREVAAGQQAAQLAQQATSLLADFQKASADRQMTRVERDKTKRLQLLELEYKQGRLSKEQYEASKAQVEDAYQARARQLKRDAAEKEKRLSIAQAIIAGTQAVLAAAASSGGFLTPQTILAGIMAAANVAKIIATPIPEFERGGVFGRVSRTARRMMERGGRINPVAGVPQVGSLHRDGGIQMIDGATGEHLGEWERGEPYLILSRRTYANNRHIIDELIDTSLYRGGAPIQYPQRRRGIHAESGAVVGGTGGLGGGQSDAVLVDLLAQVATNTAATHNAVQALPSRQRVVVDDESVAGIEEKLNQRTADRAEATAS